MNAREKAEQYLATQQSLQLYEVTRTAFIDVLSALPEEEYDEITDNLVLMVMHEGAIAQVMHFEPTTEKYKVLQLTIPHDISPEVLRWVIAHELGHVKQGRNWREEDGMSLEDDATAQAARWGFEKTDAIATYLDEYRNRF
jgi:hypothetical protein